MVDPKYFRPTEVDLLIGDATKARKKLGWAPKYDLPALVKEMVAADIDLFRKENCLRNPGSLSEVNRNDLSLTLNANAQRSANRQRSTVIRQPIR